MSSALLLAMWLASASTEGQRPTQGSSASAAAPHANSAAELLRLADIPRKALVNTEVEVQTTVSQEGKPDRSFGMKVYIGSENRELVIFTDAKDRGRKFLMSGNRTWLLVSGSKHPIAISPNQRMVGSFSFADLARILLSTDFSGVLRQKQEPCGASAKLVNESCSVVDITATSRIAPYASGTLWIDAHGLLQRAIYALPSGKTDKEVEYSYSELDGKPVFLAMKITDLLMPAEHLVTTLKFGEPRPSHFSDQQFEPEYALTH